MRYLPLIAGVLLICAPAKADKFWLSDPKAEPNPAAGSALNLIEGVLLSEDADTYHVRVEGGEIVLPKKSVFKIEKDELSVNAIAKAEANNQEAGELANEERRLAQATQRAEREVRFAEASARRSAQAVEAYTTRLQVVPVAAASFDPVLGVAIGYNSQVEMMRDAQQVVPVAAAGFDPVLGVAIGYNSQFEMMRYAQLAWNMTKDRSYLELLRQLRRLR